MSDKLIPVAVLLALALLFFVGVIIALCCLCYSVPPIDPQDQDGEIPYKAGKDEV